MFIKLVSEMTPKDFIKTWLEIDKNNVKYYFKNNIQPNSMLDYCKEYGITKGFYLYMCQTIYENEFIAWFYYCNFKEYYNAINETLEYITSKKRKYDYDDDINDKKIKLY
jgi:hypothetical protein